jgi:hypothetical protein
MKTCIIGLPRSRSSILLETISLYHSIKILGEDIGQIKNRSSPEYIIKLKELLDKSSAESAGVMRLHPLQMVSVGKGVVFPLDFNWFNFKQYDKIYFTYRESVADSIASTFVADKLNKFTYQNVNDLVQFKEPFYFCKTKDFWHIRDYINNIKIMNLLKEYLDLHEIEYSSLYYNEIPSYISNKFPNTQTFHIETHYNYKEIISNYDEILKLYNLTLPNHKL